MLASRGFRVSEKVLKDFLDFIKKVSSWFLAEGSLTLADWKRVGKDMRKYVQEHGEGVLPNHAYPLWLQMRELLTDETDFEGLVHETSSLSLEQTNEVKPINQPTKSYGTKK